MEARPLPDHRVNDEWRAMLGDARERMNLVFTKAEQTWPQSVE